VGSILAMRFVAFFSLLRRRLGRCYRRNAGPHVALAQLKSESTRLSKKKSPKMPHRGPTLAIFLAGALPRRPPAATPGLMEDTLGIGGGGATGRGCPGAGPRDRRHGTSAARSSSWFSSSSEPETGPLPPFQSIVSATYRVRGRARRPRPEAAAYAPAAACHRRFPRLVVENAGFLVSDYGRQF